MKRAVFYLISGFGAVATLSIGMLFASLVYPAPNSFAAGLAGWLAAAFFALSGFFWWLITQVWRR
jgi:hypothetical protein